MYKRYLATKMAESAKVDFITEYEKAYEEFKRLSERIDTHLKSIPKFCTAEDFEKWKAERKNWREDRIALENVLHNETKKVKIV